jgi:hypothetical protein
MTTHPDDSPFAPSMTDDPADADELEPIVIPYRDALGPLVGPLTHVEVGHVNAETLAWAGEEAGSVRSGTASLDVDVRDDGTSILLAWRVEVDETPTG